MASDEFDALIKLLRDTSAEAVPVAENAAAEVFRSVIQSAAPRKTGQLAASIKIIEGRKIKGITGEQRGRLFVGPEKKKGYYGYWGEHGRKGFTIKPKPGKKVLHWKDRDGKDVFVKSADVGLQPKRPWFDAAVKSADGSATQAAEDAFNAKLAELDERS